MTTIELPIACDLQAIPAGERAEHLGTAEQLLTRLAEAIHELPDGYALRFAAEQYARVTAFIGNERRCCPFYTFALEVPPGGAPLSLHITGPEGAKDLLAATLLAQPPSSEAAGPELAVAPSAQGCECCA